MRWFGLSHRRPFEVVEAVAAAAAPAYVNICCGRSDAKTDTFNEVKHAVKHFYVSAITILYNVIIL